MDEPVVCIVEFSRVGFRSAERVRDYGPAATRPRTELCLEQRLAAINGS